MWSCAAIDHGVTIFPNGKIGPCCQIEADYLKPISELHNPNRFADLKTVDPPGACTKCHRLEHNNQPSYKKMFNQAATNQPGIQFLDIRNSNQCNLKCRYCGPHFSSSWANELAGTVVPIQRQDITNYRDILLTDSLHWVYFTGGEPIILPEHWELLEELAKQPRAQNIRLLYNTNLTTLKYKNKNISDLWKKFKSVSIQCSIDAVGDVFESIRSGASWHNVKENLLSLQCSAVDIALMPVISILNVWHLEELMTFAVEHNLNIRPIVLNGPDYLALDVIPDELKDLALEKIECLRNNYPDTWHQCFQLISSNTNHELFKQTISHILLLDELRGEKLFKLLPFKQIAQDRILKNYEYE